MLTERQIKADLARAKDYASELEDEAGCLTKLANSSLEGVFDELRVAWKGDNAEKYLRKGESLQADIENTAKALKNIAATIRSNAQNTYAAEMENLRIYQEKQRELAKQAINVISNVAETSGGVAGKVASEVIKETLSSIDTTKASTSGSSGGGHSSGGGRRG